MPFPNVSIYKPQISYRDDQDLLYFAGILSVVLCSQIVNLLLAKSLAYFECCFVLASVVPKQLSSAITERKTFLLREKDGVGLALFHTFDSERVQNAVGEWWSSVTTFRGQNFFF